MEVLSGLANTEDIRKQSSPITVGLIVFDLLFSLVDVEGLKMVGTFQKFHNIAELSPHFRVPEPLELACCLKL